MNPNELGKALGIVTSFGYGSREIATGFYLGREQLAAEKFAEALESIPLALAVNTGFDPIDTQVELREKHGDDKTCYGVDVLGNGVKDLFKMDVIEPVSVKEQIIKSATECTCMLLRIDDVIANSKKGPSMPTPGPTGPDGTEGME